MASGKIKWFDNKKGFGFIAQESGKDVFVHHTAHRRPGIQNLRGGRHRFPSRVVPSEKGAESRKRPARAGSVTPGEVKFHFYAASIFVRQR